MGYEFICNIMGDWLQTCSEGNHRYPIKMYELAPGVVLVIGKLSVVETFVYYDPKRWKFNKESDDPRALERQNFTLRFFKPTEIGYIWYRCTLQLHLPDKLPEIRERTMALLESLDNNLWHYQPRPFWPLASDELVEDEDDIEHKAPFTLVSGFDGPHNDPVTE